MVDNTLLLQVSAASGILTGAAFMLAALLVLWRVPVWPRNLRYTVAGALSLDALTRIAGNLVVLNSGVVLLETRGELNVAVAILALLVVEMLLTYAALVLALFVTIKYVPPRKVQRRRRRNRGDDTANHS